MKTQHIKMMPVHSVEKALSDLVREGFTVVSMVSTELGVLVVLEVDEALFSGGQKTDKMDKNIIFGTEQYRNGWND